MTLYELVNDVEVQGAIRLSTWKDDTEHILFQTDNTDDFSYGCFDEEYEDCKVKYIFCPGDGYLHIEIETEE